MIKNLKEKATQALALPREIVLDLPVVTVTGRGEVYIENYKNLIEFNDTKIHIRTKDGTIAVTGADLTLNQITTENLRVVGQIGTVVLE